MSVFNEAEYQAAEVVSTSQNAGQVSVQSIASGNSPLDNPGTCVKKAKAPPPAAIRTVSVLPDSHWRRHYLAVCRGNHNAATVLGKIVFRYQHDNGKSRLYLRNGCYWWYHTIRELADECELTLEQTKYALVKLREWGLVETRAKGAKVKGEKKSLFCLPIAQGAGSLNGWPTFDHVPAKVENSTLAHADQTAQKTDDDTPAKVENSTTAKVENSTIKAFKVVGSKVEGSKDFVTAPAPVTTPVIPEAISGEGDKSKSKATPENKPKAVPAWKPTGVWERTMSEYHPKAAVPLTQTQGKILRDVRTKLGILGLDSDLLMRYIVQHWYSVMSCVKGGSQIAPRPEFFSAHLAEFVLYFNKHYETDLQRQAKQAATAKYLAELAQAHTSTQSIAPKKPNKFVQLLQAEQQAKASATA
ncbi:hypothetical protein [Paraburkholderia caffeinilytica]|uniref:hypothetical protein n=1 Tax=Paraburkholderia caffeinilytica TaxID=1761016 RepID=UPI0038BD9B06